MSIGAIEPCDEVVAWVRKNKNQIAAHVRSLEVGMPMQISDEFSAELKEWRSKAEKLKSLGNYYSRLTLPMEFDSCLEKLRVIDNNSSFSTSDEPVSEKGKRSHLSKWHIGVGLALVVAVFGSALDLPYAYYMVLRFVVCAAFGFWAYEAHEKEQAAWRNGFALVALFYNPFFPIHLGDREPWIVINLMTIGMVVASSRISKE